ncbi:MAG: transcription antitermination factor NusB [Chloroflexota bacterium]|nr:transcription antitermination factor NusB [Chloroflexota bacterium]
MATDGQAKQRNRAGGGAAAPKGNGRGRQGPGNAGAGEASRSAGGKRHQGRVLALQLLYELDIAGHGVDEVLTHTFAEQPTPAGVRAHVERLVRGVLASREEIDPYIAAAAPAFPLPQLPAIDRNVLRLAIYELLREPEVPPKAAINEAVELAKRFGGDNSARFVNGVLGTVAGRVPRRGTSGAPDAVAAEGG